MIYKLRSPRFYISIFIPIVILLFSFPLLWSQYDIGDTISEEFQMNTYETCYPGNGYEIGENWKLADWNGAINGGSYNVIGIDTAAPWCAPCVSVQENLSGLWQSYQDNSHVKILTSFVDPGSPYSCEQWGALPEEGGSQIILETNYDINNAFINGYPGYIWIDHEMRVHNISDPYSGSFSQSTIIENIESMLDACGDLCVTPYHDYSLIDLNPTSETYGNTISPGYFENHITLHYFGHQN